MLGWFADRVTSLRRGPRWRRVLAWALVAVALVAGLVLIAWRRWRAARQAEIAHEVFAASVDARRKADAARAVADDARVAELRAAADEADERAATATARSMEATRTYEADRAAIARVRTWNDVAPRGPR